MRVESEALALSDQRIHLLSGNFLSRWDGGQAERELGGFLAALCTPGGHGNMLIVDLGQLEHHVGDLCERHARVYR